MSDGLHAPLDTGNVPLRLSGLGIKSRESARWHSTCLDGGWFSASELVVAHRSIRLRAAALALFVSRPTLLLTTRSQMVNLKLLIKLRKWH